MRSASSRDWARYRWVTGGRRRVLRNCKRRRWTGLGTVESWVGTEGSALEHVPGDRRRGIVWAGFELETAECQSGVLRSKGWVETETRSCWGCCQCIRESTRDRARNAKVGNSSGDSASRSQPEPAFVRWKGRARASSGESWRVN